MAGCGFVLLALLSLLALGLALVLLGLFGDCGTEAPDCHAASNRNFGWVMLGLLAANIAAASLLGWWQSRGGKS